MHGVHPSANSTPSSGAAASPTAGTLCRRTSRWKYGTTPRKTRPSTTVMTPSTTLRVSVCSKSHCPIDPKNSTSTMKTNVKPSTNSDVPATMRLRLADCRSAPERPVA